MDSLKDKVAIITGGGAGIGRSTALLFAHYGAQVVLADLNVKAVEDVASECKAKGLTESQILVVEANVTNAEDRKKIVDETISKFGRIDILINNAGIGRFFKLTETPEETYDQLMDLNVKSVVYLTQLAIPHLKETKGNIVNLASIVSEEAIPGCGVYCMTKAAVDMYSRTLALEMAEFGVRVNSVRPGVINTAFYSAQFGAAAQTFIDNAETKKHPLGRLGTPEEVAKAIAFLASDMACYTTGCHVYVDGGRHCVGAGYNPNLRPQPQQQPQK